MLDISHRVQEPDILLYGVRTFLLRMDRPPASSDVRQGLQYGLASLCPL